MNYIQKIHYFILSLLLYYLLLHVLLLHYLSVYLSILNSFRNENINDQILLNLHISTN